MTKRFKKIAAAAAAAVLAVSAMAATVSAGYVQSSNILSDYGYSYGTLRVDTLSSGNTQYKQGETGTIMSTIIGTYPPNIYATIEGYSYPGGVQLFEPYTNTLHNTNQVYCGFTSANTQTIMCYSTNGVSNDFGGSWSVRLNTVG